MSPKITTLPQAIEAIEELEARLHLLEQSHEHFVSHDRLYPKPGCPFCQVRNAQSEVRRAA